MTGGCMYLSRLSFRGKRGICFFPASTLLRGCFLSSLFAATFTFLANAQQNPALSASIEKIIDRPEFKHANFGIEFYDLATNTVVYSLNADKLFTPASTTKLLTEGSLLAKLGKDYRFHTAIYRTGPIDKKGRLKG